MSEEIRVVAKYTDEVSSGVKKTANNVNESTKTMGTGFGGLTSAIKKVGVAALGLVAIKKLADWSMENARLATVQAEADQKLVTVLNSTQHAAGLTYSELKKMASGLQDVTTIGDETIEGAQHLLLTFKEIGKDTFPRATEAVMDMSVAMGGDLKGAAIQVGKALNYPIQGVTALGRAGIQMSKTQKDMIKYFVETGHKAEAQKIILQELESEFGGLARSMADLPSGEITQIKNKIGDVREELGVNVIPLQIEWNKLLLKGYHLALNITDAFTHGYRKQQAEIENAATKEAKLNEIYLQRMELQKENEKIERQLNFGANGVLKNLRSTETLVALNKDLKANKERINKLQEQENELKNIAVEKSRKEKGLLDTREKQLKKIFDLQVASSKVGTPGATKKGGTDDSNKVDYKKQEDEEWAHFQGMHKNYLRSIAYRVDVNEEFLANQEAAVDNFNDTMHQKQIDEAEETRRNEDMKLAALESLQSEYRTRGLETQEEELASLTEWYNEKLELVRGKKEEEELLYQVYADRKLDIAAKEAEREQKIQQYALRGTASFLGSISDLLKESLKSHKEYEKAYKAIAIASIVIDTAQASMSAYRSVSEEISGEAGIILGALAAATVTAAGAVEIAKVANESFEYGGIVGGNDLTGDRRQVNVNSREMIINTSDQQNLWDFVKSNTGQNYTTNNNGTFAPVINFNGSIDESNREYILDKTKAILEDLQDRGVINNIMAA